MCARAALGSFGGRGRGEAGDERAGDGALERLIRRSTEAWQMTSLEARSAPGAAAHRVCSLLCPARHSWHCCCVWVRLQTQVGARQRGRPGGAVGTPQSKANAVLRPLCAAASVRQQAPWMQWPSRHAGQACHDIAPTHPSLHVGQPGQTSASTHVAKQGRGVRGAATHSQGLLSLSGGAAGGPQAAGGGRRAAGAAGRASISR